VTQKGTDLTEALPGEFGVGLHEPAMELSPIRGELLAIPVERRSGAGQGPLGQQRPRRELPLGRVVVGPGRRKAVQVPADPELDGRALQRIRERCLQPVSAVRLVRRGTDVRLRDPLPVNADPEPALDGTVGQELIAVLPVVDPDHGVEAVHDGPRVDVGDRQGAVALDHLRLELNFVDGERCGQLAEDGGGVRVVGATRLR
jgi:hypothetical protein